MIKRGLIHFHSEFSFDSNIKIDEIKKWAKKNKLDFLCLTDHNTMRGVEKLREECKETDIEVITGAEYNTEYGDIIGLFLKEEIKNYRNFDKLIENIRKQDGLVLFPHPYKNHSNIKYIAEKVDLIEVFNSRTSNELNELARELSIEFNKNHYFSSDAHLYSELNNAIIEVEFKNNFKTSFKNSTFKPIKLTKSKEIYIILSQIIKAIKLKNLKLLINIIKKIIYLLIKIKIFSKI
jgi:hypothetical protein